MTAEIIDGKTIAAAIREEVKKEVARRIEKNLPIPGLATILVGEDPASQVYVRSKHRACEEAGIRSFSKILSADTSQAALESAIRELNLDKKVHGILVQLPLPNGLNEEQALNTVALEKDVDGFHPVNIGRLAQKGREPLFVPCTPAGVIYLLKENISSMEGKQAVVLGRSNIVGMPVALLLLRENATVTICHSRTQNLPDVVRNADIVVAAIGKSEIVRGSWIKPGAVVIDIGVNRVDDPTRERGYRLTGDVAFEEVREIASAITPVPGGVGPMTIAMLLLNTLSAAERFD
ncbi:MAG TPA: bifunctional methylenetetrahydrofolate dehydrogenase/methenyltetrahydrofolate cyclohydrolase FolD [Pelolinea sp.]|nr:bifunctional methylenetetrahydrofolate dehydrogenase/methenyltetrahydrofolate cyclohydrolase FolD [Pelolinea sp.]